MTTTETQPPHSVLLYDGLCGFCDRTVQFISQRDKRKTMRFAPLQGAYAATLFSRFPELRTIDSLIVAEQDADGATRIHVRSAAVLEIATYLGGGWRLLGMLGRLIPRVVRDWSYNAFARRRLRVFGRLEACRLPAPEERRQFLD